MDDLLDQIDKISAQCNDLFRQVRALRESRTDGLATLNKGIDDLRQRIESRFAKVDEEQAREFEQINDRVESGRRGLIYRLDTLDQQMTAALGITIDARPRPATPVEQAINALDERLDRFAIELGGKVNARFNASFITDPSHTMPPSKPTIKGGWANVYQHGQMNLYADKASADAGAAHRRIACIRIPDFTEGEGL